MKSIIHKIKSIHLNPIDHLVIFSIAIVLGTFLYFSISKKTEWIDVRMVISKDEWWYEGQPPQYWYVDNIESGQVSYNAFGEKIAEIINIESFDIGGYRRRSYVDVKLKGSYDNTRKLYLYNYQPLQIGKPIDLTFGKHNVKGLVTYIDSDEITYFTKKIEVILLRIEPWVAESYKTGMQMKDSQNRVLATVNSIDIKLARQISFSDIRGQNIEVINPQLRDVSLQITIKTFKSSETFYFVDRAAIKIGEKIWFQFPEAVVRDAEITKII